MTFYSPTLPPQIREKPFVAPVAAYDALNIPGYGMDKSGVVRHKGLRVDYKDSYGDGKNFTFTDKVTGKQFLVIDTVAIAKADEIRLNSKDVFAWKNAGSKWRINYKKTDILMADDVKFFSQTEFAFKTDRQWEFAEFDFSRPTVLDVIVKSGVVGDKIQYCRKGMFQVLNLTWILCRFGKVVDRSKSDSAFIVIDYERWFHKDSAGNMVHHDVIGYYTEEHAIRDGRNATSFGDNAFIWFDYNNEVNLVVGSKVVFSGLDVKYDNETDRFIGLDKKSNWNAIAI